jgi:tetratricopeptide (TPR) repeat protein
MRGHACALALLLFFFAAPGAAQKPRPADPLPPISPLDLARVLDLYAEGRFDEAVTRVSRAGGEVGRRLRRHWDVTARQWIDADPARRPQRILVAAALALETEHVRAERGEWRMTEGTSACTATCVLDWAQLQLVQRGPADHAERAWYLAAASLAGGVRDWRYLARSVHPSRAAQVLPGLMDRALARFPGDPMLQLERAVAATARFNVIMDGGRRAPTIALPPGILSGPGGFSLAGLGLDPDAAAAMLAALVDDPLVGPEARMRLGYLYWIDGRDEAAQSQLTMAAERAADADVRYLARFLLGWIAIKRGDSAGAIPHLEAALAARPGAQSAALALASLELQRGDADKGHQIARASLDQADAAGDPWRSFLYGHHAQWPSRLAALRKSIRP